MAEFSELSDIGVISAQGPDAAAFLHAQLTSDVAGLAPGRVQYSGYCSAKGRLLATFLLWREADRVFLLLPRSLRDAIQARLSKYVLRSKVVLTDATPDLRLFGIWGADAAACVASAIGEPADVYDVAGAASVRAARLPGDRYLAIAAAEDGSTLRESLSTRARERTAGEWSRLDIESGIGWITPESQELYVPQMVNLDLVGAVSYNKGCYPGQEIVARTHYLGRLKQRMYRIHLPATSAPAPGDSLYSATFGAEQASGAVLNAAPAPDGGYDALAVIQTAAASEGAVHWKAPDGAEVDLRPLPYHIPV